MARGYSLAQPHLVGNIVEDLAQPLLVAPVRGGCDPEDAGIRIGRAHPVNDAAIAVGDGVMRLVDDQQVKARHGGQIALTRQRGHHGEGNLTTPGFGSGIHNRGGYRGIDPAKLLAVLGR